MNLVDTRLQTIKVKYVTSMIPPWPTEYAVEVLFDSAAPLLESFQSLDHSVEVPPGPGGPNKLFARTAETETRGVVAVEPQQEEAEEDHREHQGERQVALHEHGEGR